MLGCASLKSILNRPLLRVKIVISQTNVGHQEIHRMANKLTQNEVLRYQKDGRPQATVKRYYIKWRLQQCPPIPDRCDNSRCIYHHEPLIWNGIELKLVLDHESGVSWDNRPKNLRLLCPNCNSQQSTHGGGNKDKIKKIEGGYVAIRDDGTKNQVLPAEAGSLKTKVDNGKG